MLQQLCFVFQVVDTIAVALRQSIFRNSSRKADDGSHENAVRHSSSPRERFGHHSYNHLIRYNGGRRNVTVRSDRENVTHPQEQAYFIAYSNASHEIKLMNRKARLTVDGNDELAPETETAQSHHHLLRSDRRPLTVFAHWDSFITSGYDGNWPSEYW